MLNLEPNELNKNHVTLLYEDKENRVTWFADTSLEDVKFAIICACDALVDGEFEVLDEKAQVVDIEKSKEIRSGAVFFLRKKHNKPTNILLDGNRKLFVEIDPLRHIESQVALKYAVVYFELVR